MYAVIGLLLAADLPPTEQLVYAAAMLGLTLAFGCALEALLFYRRLRHATAAPAGAGRAPSAPHPPQAGLRPAAPAQTATSRPRPQPAAGYTTAPPPRTAAPASGGRASRAGAVNEKQLRRFETLLANLEREYRQGTVSAPVYRKLRREYENRIAELRSGR